MSTPPLPPSKDSLASGLVLKPVKTSPYRIQPQKQRESVLRRLMRLGGLSIILIGAGTLVSASLWTSALLILRPHPPRWLAEHLPGWSKGWGEMPVQTLADIETELSRQERYLGDLIDLSLASEDAQLRGLKLLPVFETRSPCNQDCEAIVELRLYGLHNRNEATDNLQLLHQLAIEGPTEEEVLDPISHGDIGTVGSTYQLPLESLKPLYEQGLPGGWFSLTGRWRTQGSPVLYGQLIYINPQTLRIYSLLNWKSPPGRLPVWFNFDDEGLPELMVNQSYGLEPSFSIYSVGNVNAMNATTRLQEVTLTPTVLPPSISSRNYQNALFLAQQALWSDAQRGMTSLKQQAADRWSTELERQLQLIMLHARFSQSQADRDWSQPSQKLLALLLDGQWQKALAAVNQEISYQRTVLPLLERDSSRIWQRITASLRVNANQKEAQLWGALLLMAKENEAAAVKWLTQNKNAALKKEFEAIAKTISTPDPQSSATVAATPAPKAVESDPSPVTEGGARTSPLTGLFGVAVPVASINPEAWQLPLKDAEQLPAQGQQWYLITLQAGHGRQQWRQQLPGPQGDSPQAITDFLQTLGLPTGSPVQLVNLVTGQLAQTVQVKGVQMRGETLTLLASGAPAQGPGALIAALPNQWGSPTTSPSQSLLALFRNHPEISDRLLPTLNDHLGFDSASLTATLQQQANGAPPLATVRWINFTDNTDPEILLTLTPELVSFLGIERPQQIPISLIVTAQGELLYSNLWSGASQMLIGWVQPAPGVSALVTTAGDRVNLLIWSPQDRRYQ